MLKEYTYEHWVVYRTGESLYCTPENNIMLYVNSSEIKIKNVIQKEK